MVENTNVPVLYTEGRSLAEAWENAVVKLFEEGARVQTSYDKPSDPPSYEATLTYVTLEPLSEPMIHMCFPGGPADLEEYAMEVCEGIKDHWQRDIDDPTDERWEYTYHARMFAYNLPDGTVVDQFEKVARRLAGVDNPKETFKRSNQVSLWKPWEDPRWSSPPCLQRIWFRVMPGADGRLYLNMNVHFRSRDAFDAAFMNSFAFIRLMKMMRDRVVELNPALDLQLGRYADTSDSFHIYGSKFREVEERFLGGIKNRTFEERTASYADVWKEMMDEERPRIIEKVRDYDA
ncbi:MAG: thymidylate synthase, partial [Planctomycetota bacterium]